MSASKLWELGALTLTICAMVCACSGPGQQEYSPMPVGTGGTPPVTEPVALPAPSNFAARLKPHTAAYVPADLQKSGADFDVTLPHQRVTANASSADFTPDWDSPAQVGFDRLAFATYAFSLKGYSGQSKVAYIWATPPSKPGNSYFAVANWQRDRWDWFRGNAGAVITLPALAPYLDFGGDFVVCVLRVGLDASTLASLRVGSLPPTASLSASTLAGLAPLDVQFNAAASTDADGSITNYEWDPEGDGSFVSSGATPQYSFNYSTAGDFEAAVRVTDNSGTYTTTSIHVRVAGTTTLSCGLPGSLEQASAVLPTDSGDICVVGTVLVGGTQRQGLYCKVSPDGTAVFAKLYGDDIEQWFNWACRAGDRVYICGYEGATGILQQWDTDGNLLWNKTLTGTDDYVEPAAICATSDALYVAGRMWLTTLSRDVGLLMRFDLNGNLIWKHSFIPVGQCALSDVKPQLDDAGNVLSVQACGDLNSGGTGTDVLYLTFTPDGDTVSSQTWGSDGSSEYSDKLFLTGPQQAVTYIAAYGSGLSYVLQPGGTSLVLDGGSSQSPLNLFSTPRAPLTFGLSDGVHDLGLDYSDLGGERFSSDANTFILLQQMSPYGPNGLVAAGNVRGTGAVTTDSRSDSLQESSQQWISTFVSTGNPSMTVSDSSGVPLDPPGFEVNADDQPYGDILIYIEPHN